MREIRTNVYWPGLLVITSIFLHGKCASAQWCYVDDTRNCADAVLDLYKEGLLPPNNLISCGECDPPVGGEDAFCPNWAKLLALANISYTLPFARSIIPQDGGAKDDFSEGTIRDCGQIDVCTPDCIEVVVNGQAVWRCQHELFDSVLPVSERYEDGHRCRL